jgi:hypothetical protein
MSPQVTAKSRAKAEQRASLDDFYAHLRYSNPFDQDRVSKSSEAVVDVLAIHRRQYETLIALAEKARRDGRGIGATLWGQPRQSPHAPASVLRLSAQHARRSGAAAAICAQIGRQPVDGGPERPPL